MERDPSAFLKNGVPAGWGIEPDIQGEAIGALSEADLNAAAALAPEILGRNNSQSATLYNQLAASAVEKLGCNAALEWAASLTQWPADTRENLQAKLLESLALEDPVRAGAELSKILGYGMESSAQVVSSLLAKHDPAAALTWLRGLNTNFQMDAMLAQIGQAIGPNAETWVQAVAKGNIPSPETGEPSDPFAPQGNRLLYDYHFREMLTGISHQDAVRLAQDLATQPASETQSMLLSMSLGAVAQQDPAMALQLADGLPEALAAAARRQIAQSISSSDQISSNFSLEDELILLKQVDADSSATDGRGADAGDALLSSIAERDPKAALAVLKTVSHYSASAIEMIFGTWTSQHPSEAAQGIGELSAGQQSFATKTVMETWLGLDSIAASQWAQQLPSGAAKDEASAIIIKQLTESNTEPDSAFAWAASMSDDRMRIGSLKYVLKAWKDHNAAEQAIQQSALPESTKQECLNVLNTRGK